MASTKNIVSEKSFYNKIVCEKCKGDGYTSRDELTDYHRGLYRTEYSQCSMCDGSGILKQETHIILSKYSPPVELKELTSEDYM